MESSDRLFTVNQCIKLKRLIGESKAEKIMPLLNLFVDMEYETKKSIYNFFIMSGNHLYLVVIQIEHSFKLEVQLHMHF